MSSICFGSWISWEGGKSQRSCWKDEICNGFWDIKFFIFPWFLETIQPNFRRDLSRNNRRLSCLWLTDQPSPTNILFLHDRSGIQNIRCYLSKSEPSFKLSGWYQRGVLQHYIWRWPEDNIHRASGIGVEYDNGWK